MENLIRKMQVGEIPAKPCVVISDNPEAAAIEKAKRLSVPVAVVPRKNFSTKQDFEAAIEEYLRHHQADLICLAGFMRILSPEFIRKYPGKIINIHPSLLPAFPGAHGIRDALEAKVKETGVTVHYVDEGIDTGEMILQRKIAIDPKDTLESLEVKIHAAEYELYPEALRKILP